MADFEPGPVGELTGLPLSKFATAELVARAHQAGYVNLWDYVEALEDAISEEGIWHHVTPDLEPQTTTRILVGWWNPDTGELVDVPGFDHVTEPGRWVWATVSSDDVTLGG